MWSEILFVFCAVFALQASLVFCLPTSARSDDAFMGDHNEITKHIENDEEDGYQIILKSPSQFLKVEVVDDEGNPTMRDIEVPSREEVEHATETSEQELTIKSRKSRGERRQLERDHKCNWRRLYKQFVSRKRQQSNSRVKYSKSKRMEIRKAFQTICDNPEESITYLLDMEG